MSEARALIARIRDGGTPPAADLRWFAQGLASGVVSDAQAGAFAMAVLLPHVMREYGASAHKRLAELADVCGIGGENEAEKANAFIRWIEDTNRKMGLPDSFNMIRDEDIDQMITWARKEANPLYPVPVVWSRKDFLRFIESIRR